MKICMEIKLVLMKVILDSDIYEHGNNDMIVTEIYATFCKYGGIPIKGLVEDLFTCVLPSYEDPICSRVGSMRPNVFDVERLLSHSYCTLYLS